MPVCPREFGGKSDNLSHLGTSVIYLIAADSTPEPAWQAVIDAGANGKIAVAQAKAIIAAHKPPQPPATQPPADTELVRKHDYKFLHHPLPPYGDNSTETKWFQLLLGRFPVCFLNRRLALRHWSEIKHFQNLSSSFCVQNLKIQEPIELVVSSVPSSLKYSSQRFPLQAAVLNPFKLF